MEVDRVQSPKKTDFEKSTYRLGCPAWAHAPWKGVFFRKRTQSKDFLKEYAQVFDSVEGNTTFYGVPKPDTIQKWADQVPESFRFCFKFPQWISHRRPFQSDPRSALEFLKTMAPLKSVMGPVFLQTPPALGPESLNDLYRFFSELPRDFKYAMEPRHPAFFEANGGSNELNAMLRELAVDRVIFETRPLFESQWQDADTQEAKGKKPRQTPLIAATANQPILRLVTNLEPDIFNPYLEKWSDVFVDWIKHGKNPYFMAHTPNDTEAPELGRRFQRLLNSKLDTSRKMPIRDWPAETEEGPSEKNQQLDLFG